MRRWPLLTLLAIASPGLAWADWPASGNPLDTATPSLADTYCFSDSAQGLIVAGLDFNPGSPLHFQHLMATGAYGSGFDANGVAALAADHATALDGVVSDRRGGAWIAWEGCAATGPCGVSSLRILHVDGSGQPVSGMNPAGVLVRGTSGMLNALVVPDTPGGVIVAWTGVNTSKAFAL